jgi:hypothetical protein
MSDPFRSSVLHLSFGMSAIKELRCTAGTGDVLKEQGLYEGGHILSDCVILVPLPNQL